MLTGRRQPETFSICVKYLQTISVYIHVHNKHFNLLIFFSFFLLYFMQYLLWLSLLNSNFVCQFCCKDPSSMNSNFTTVLGPHLFHLWFDLSCERFFRMKGDNKIHLRMFLQLIPPQLWEDRGKCVSGKKSILAPLQSQGALCRIQIEVHWVSQILECRRNEWRCGGWRACRWNNELRIQRISNVWEILQESMRPNWRGDLQTWTVKCGPKGFVESTILNFNLIESSNFTNSILVDSVLIPENGKNRWVHQRRGNHHQYQGEILEHKFHDFQRHRPRHIKVFSSFDAYLKVSNSLFLSYALLLQNFVVAISPQFFWTQKYFLPFVSFLNVWEQIDVTFFQDCFAGKGMRKK